MINLDVKRKASRDWKARNKARVLAYQKEYEQKNPAVRRAYRLRHREKISGYQKKWVEKNRVHVRVYNNTKAALKKSTADGSITVEAINALYEKQGGKCAISGKSLANGYHIDHIIPVSKGGRHTISNIQLLLPEVNLQKSDKLDFTYIL